MPCTVLVTDDELNKNQYYCCLYENCTLVGEERYSSKNNNNKFNIKNEYFSWKKWRREQGTIKFLTKGHALNLEGWRNWAQQRILSDLWPVTWALELKCFGGEKDLLCSLSHLVENLEILKEGKKFSKSLVYAFWVLKPSAFLL